VVKKNTMNKVFTIFFVLLSLSLQAQLKITGTVKDARSGETVIGASISVKGTTNGTVTDLNGKFELDVPSLPQTLVISYLGYKSTEIVFTDASSPMNVRLQTSEVQLKGSPGHRQPHQ
jgi:hypothetical protein